MIGKTIGHYEILDRLGAGGMGEVYRARDRKLGREVALKTLPPGMAGDARLTERLNREARAVASLNHPHIVTVYSVEESEGVHFLTMELVRGKTLDQVIPGEGLAVDRLLAIGLAVADALAAAHRVGVVHRDVKPGNVMVDDEGRIKVLDFGLAKIDAPAETAPGAAVTQPILTEDGVIMGTFPYMSPEQVQGEPVDARSDIFSVGVMLFEMATGRRPFQGKTSMALASSIMRDPPPALAGLRPGLPDALARIINRCLEKDPERRFATAADLVGELRALEGAGTAASSLSSPGAHRPSAGRRLPVWLGAAAAVLIAVIGGWQARSGCAPAEAHGAMAVLPFVNTAQDPDTEYLSDGVTESLINRLSQLSNLKVMSRHSVFRFKDSDEDPQEIGRQLGVTSVLVGHVDLRGDNLIVGTELLDVRDGSQIWGERFESRGMDLLAIERDIAGRITEKLRVRLTGEESRRLAQGQDVDPEAYNLYLKGRHFMVGSTTDELARAREYFQKALEVDPQLALAYAGLADCYVTQTWLNSADRDDALPKARAALARAMEIDDTLCEAHVTAGDVKFYFDWDWAGAQAEYERAIELGPNNDQAYREYGGFLLLMGRVDEGIAMARKAVTLDPLSTHGVHTLAYCYLVAERYDEAVADFKQAIELNPSWIWGNIKLSRASALNGDCEGARAAVARADELLDGRPGSPLSQLWLANVALLCGDPSRMREVDRRLMNQAAESYVDPYILASVKLDLGDEEAALDLLEQAYETRSPLLPYLLVDSWRPFRPLADHPRFTALLEKMAFPASSPSS